MLVESITDNTFVLIKFNFLLKHMKLLKYKTWRWQG